LNRDPCGVAIFKKSRFIKSGFFIGMTIASAKETDLSNFNNELSFLKAPDPTNSQQLAG